MAKKAKPIHRKKNIVQEYVEALLFAFVVAMIIRNFTFENFKIPSSSMESTMLIGDHLVAIKPKFMFTNPKREDIVTFRYPSDSPFPTPPENFVKLCGPLYWDKTKGFFKYHAQKNVVKRVIGLPGETIEIKNDIVYIDGKKFVGGYEQFVDKTRFLSRGQKITWNSQSPEYVYSEVNYGDYDGKEIGTVHDFGPVKVPEGSYFVLGDNRDMSKDSRYWGFLDRKYITGTPFMIFFSIGTPPFKNIREMALHQQGKYNPPAEVRWDRFFKRIK